MSKDFWIARLHRDGFNVPAVVITANEPEDRRHVTLSMADRRAAQSRSQSRGWERVHLEVRAMQRKKQVPWKERRWWSRRKSFEIEVSWARLQRIVSLPPRSTSNYETCVKSRRYRKSSCRQAWPFSILVVSFYSLAILFVSFYGPPSIHLFSPLLSFLFLLSSRI